MDKKENKIIESDIEKIEQFKVLREYELNIEDEPTNHSLILRRIKFESTL